MDLSEMPEDFRSTMEKQTRKAKRKELFTLEHFEAAIRWGAVKTIKLRAEGPEFVLEATTKDGRVMRLGMARSARERKFRSAGTALVALRDLGLKEVMVEVEHYRPVKGLFLKRPDMSLRMKAGHEAARKAIVDAINQPDVDKISALKMLMLVAGKK